MAVPGRLTVELREVAWRAPGEQAASGPAIWKQRPKRRGVLVRVEDARGAVGLGEASPLAIEAVREADEFDATREALRSWQAAAPDVRNADEAFAVAAEACAGSAAARFAVETALCDLLAARRGVTFAEVLAAAPAQAIPINAVCDPQDIEAATQAEARGIRTIKLKLESRPLPRLGVFVESDQDATALENLLRRFGDGMQWRGDANRTWQRVHVKNMLEPLQRFQYVEEPCHELWQLFEDAPSPSLPPLALDESAVGASDEQIASWMKHPRIGALVIKPTRVGLATSLGWAKLATAAGKAAVITHALEGPVAMAACAEIARAIGATQPAIAVGLDAHPGLDAWPVRAPQILASEVRAAKAHGLGLAEKWDQLIPTSRS